MKKANTGKKMNIWGFISGGLIAAYTVFVLLDAFVIPRDVVRIQDIEQSSSDSGDGALPNTKTALTSITESASTPSSELHNTMQGETSQPYISQPVITENSYKDENISINIQTVRQFDTDVYIADIVLSDPSYLKAGLAQGSFGRNIKATTSEMAEQNDAILAINGDYYGFRDNGYVMRNGYLYRETLNNSEDLVIYDDGSFGIINEFDVTAPQLAQNGAVQIFSFGPGLIKDGQITVRDGEEVEQAMQSNPRTAVGIIEPLHYVFVVSDGRTEKSAGLELIQLAHLMKQLGCENAYNLDGGGSSTMWFMGQVVNNPTSHGNRTHERSISDIVYIG